MTDLNLSQRQQATVAAAVTLFCAVFILCFLAAFFWAVRGFIIRFSNIILPLAVAGVLALILKPYHRWLTRRFHGRRLLAVFAVYLSALVPLTLVLFFVGRRVVDELSDLIRTVIVVVPEVWDAIRERLPLIQEIWERYDLHERLTKALENHWGEIAKQIANVGMLTGGAIGSLFEAIAGMLSWFVLPIYLAYFLMAKPRRREQLEHMLPFLKEGTRDDVIYLGREFAAILVTFFRGQLLIAFAQGLMFALGFSLIGLKYGFTLGLLLGFLNIIPYLGSVVGLAVALPLAFFQPEGGIMLVLYALIVFSLVQWIEGYFLTPKIMGDRTGLHPVAIIVAVFFWGSVFGGITGMVLAIPLTAFLVVFWRLARDKYIRGIV